MVPSWIAPVSENSDTFWSAEIWTERGEMTVASELIEAWVVLSMKASDRMPFRARLPLDDPDVGAIANSRSVVSAVTLTSLCELRRAPEETPAIVLLVDWTRLSVPPAAVPGLSEPGNSTKGPNTPPMSIDVL